MDGSTVPPPAARHARDLPRPREEVERAFAVAARALNRGKTIDAEKIFRAVAEGTESGFRAEAWVRLARLHERCGRPDAAIGSWRQVERYADPADTPGIAIDLARCLEERGESARAACLYDEVASSAVAPRLRVVALFRLARIFDSGGDRAMAAALLRSALHHEERLDPQIALTLAEVLLRRTASATSDQAERDEADRLLDLVIETDHPDHAPAAALLLARLRHHEGRSEAAERLCALVSDSGHPAFLDDAHALHSELIQGQLGLLSAPIESRVIAIDSQDGCRQAFIPIIARPHSARVVVEGLRIRELPAPLTPRLPPGSLECFALRAELRPADRLHVTSVGAVHGLPGPTRLLWREGRDGSGRVRTWATCSSELVAFVEQALARLAGRGLIDPGGHAFVALSGKDDPADHPADLLIGPSEERPIDMATVYIESARSCAQTLSPSLVIRNASPFPLDISIRSLSAAEQSELDDPGIMIRPRTVAEDDPETRSGSNWSACVAISPPSSASTAFAAICQVMLLASAHGARPAAGRTLGASIGKTTHLRPGTDRLIQSTETVDPLCEIDGADYYGLYD
jgi:tetratricopeptide (TPR) repeat protein